MKQKVMHTNKVEIKRKVKLIEANPTNIIKKAPLKSELLAKLIALEGEYDALKKENEHNIEVIKTLELKVKGLQEISSKAKDSPILESVSVQTDEIILCHKCDYEAEDRYELDAHTWSAHDDESMEVHDYGGEIHKVDNYADDFKCNFCDNNFKTKRDMMKGDSY